MAMSALAAGGQSPGRQTLKPARSLGWQGQEGRAFLSGRSPPPEGPWHPVGGFVPAGWQEQEGSLQGPGPGLKFWPQQELFFRQSTRR